MDKILPSRITSAFRKKIKPENLSTSLRGQEISISNLMKVILLENIRRIGSIGDIIDVKRGFARNYLIANKKGLYASKENIKQVEKIKSELNKKDLEKEKIAKQIHDNINKIHMRLKNKYQKMFTLWIILKEQNLFQISFHEKDKVEIKPFLIQLIKLKL